MAGDLMVVGSNPGRNLQAIFGPRLMLQKIPCPWLRGHRHLTEK